MATAKQGLIGGFHKMKQIQFQTEGQYLCFNHAVKQVLKGEDERTISAVTTNDSLHCVKCVLEEIRREQYPKGTADFLISRANKEF